jgi:hypothetical protein
MKLIIVCVVGCAVGVVAMMVTNGDLKKALILDAFYAAGMAVGFYLAL